MAIEKFDSTRVLEPDLICSKDGEVLERSERETVRFYEDFIQVSLSFILGMLGRRF